jgi:3-hydroxyisobutyrate dehydrogenase-like beta-hydroxyacid dehydrogenase
MEKERIAWIGLGKMGLPLAGRLLEAGYEVVAYDPLPDQIQKLVGRGGEGASSAMDAAIGSDFIFTMVTNDEALEKATIGPNGALEVASSGTVLVDMGTHSPKTSSLVAQRADEKDVAFLRAPVSGTRMHAADGTLTLFASGPEEIYMRCIPIFNTFTTKTSWVGEGEEARYLKLLHNAMLGVISLMLSEALAFGQKGGLELSQMLDVLNESVVTSPVIGYKTEAMKQRTFDLTFTASQMAKDLDLALSAAGQLEVPMPLTAMVRQFMGAMSATGRGEEDFFAVLKLMEELAGVKR